MWKHYIIEDWENLAREGKESIVYKCGTIRGLGEFSCTIPNEIIL